MGTDATEVRISVLEREITLLRAASKDEAEFRGELRAFMAEQRAYSKERANDAAQYERRLEAAEKGIRELEAFRYKVLGAVAASGVLGGGAGALGQVLLGLIGG